MSAQQLTLWHRPELKPVRVGVYGTKFMRIDELSEPQGYSFWNGRHWGYQSSSPDDAATPQYSGASRVQWKSWRGLTAEASA